MGGIVFPTAFLLVAIFVLRDTGGPLFWPILCALGGAIGELVGWGTGLFWRHKG